MRAPELPELPHAVTDFGVRAVRRFLEIEGPLQATVLAAQAFTSIIPFLVVVASFWPGDGGLADAIVERFDLEGNSKKSVEALFRDAGGSEGTITWVGLIILILATTSFTRAMQRVFERSYRVTKAPLRETWRGLAWLAGFALWVTISAPLRETLREDTGLVLAVTASALTGFILWLWTPSILLGDITWRRLAPGALVSAVLAAMAGVASSIYVPIAMTWSADKYGLIGIAFSIQSWLLVMGFVIVIGAVVGAVVNELWGEHIDARLARRSKRRRRERA